MLGIAYFSLFIVNHKLRFLVVILPVSHIFTIFASNKNDFDIFIFAP